MASGTQIYHAPPSDCFDWSAALTESVRSPAELCRLLELDPALAAEAEAAAGSFSLIVPQPFLARICRGDPSDPLLLQVLPRAAETTSSTGYSLDPLGEADALDGLGLLRKYRGRSLIVATGACSVHCRFCFRRHFPYGLSRPGAIVLPSPPPLQWGGRLTIRRILQTTIVAEPWPMPCPKLRPIARFTRSSSAAATR